MNDIKPSTLCKHKILRRKCDLCDLEEQYFEHNSKLRMLVEANKTLIKHWDVVRGKKRGREFPRGTDFLINEIEKLLDTVFI